MSLHDTTRAAALAVLASALLAVAIVAATLLRRTDIAGFAVVSACTVGSVAAIDGLFATVASWPSRRVVVGIGSVLLAAIPVVVGLLVAAVTVLVAIQMQL